MSRLGAFESLRSEGVGEVPPLAIALHMQGHQGEQRALRQLDALKLHVAQGLPLQECHRWVQPQDLTDHLAHLSARRQACHDIGAIRVEGGAFSGEFLAQAHLPLGVLGQEHQGRRQGAGGGVVRGHHQEHEVVDDLFVAQLMPVFIAGTGKLAEQVGPGLCAALVGQAQQLSHQACSGPKAARVAATDPGKAYQCRGGVHQFAKVALGASYLSGILQGQQQVSGP